MHICSGRRSEGFSVSALCVFSSKKQVDMAIQALALLGGGCILVSINDKVSSMESFGFKQNGFHLSTIIQGDCGIFFVDWGEEAEQFLFISNALA